MSFIEEAEEKLKYKQKNVNTDVTKIFLTAGSSGKNPEKLAKILTVFDLLINILGWKDKPIANLTHYVTQYQASIDGGYHKDFKDVLVAEEIERRKENRKGLSLNG